MDKVNEMLGVKGNQPVRANSADSQRLASMEDVDDNDDE